MSVKLGVISKPPVALKKSLWRIVMDTLSGRRFGKPTQPAKKIEEAFVGLLVAAALCDGDMAPEESTELNALLTRTKTLRPYTSDEIGEISAKVHAELSDPSSFDEVVASYCSAIVDSGMAESLFAHCTDLVRCDTIYRLEEQEFLGRISEFLSIEEARAASIFDVIELKNNF